MQPSSLAPRLIALGVVASVCLCVCFGFLFDAQIVNGEEYLLRSQRSHTRTETVEAARGIITDRNGKVLVSNRLVYALSFDKAEIADEALDGAILRVLELLDAQGIEWTDDLPLTAVGEIAYAPRSSSQLKAFVDYLSACGAMSAEEVDAEGYPAFTAQSVFHRLCEEFAIDEAAPYARGLLGFRYSLALAEQAESTSFTFLADADVSLISRIKDGRYEGVRVVSSSVREYETDAAAHVLGKVGKIYAEEYAELKEKGYAYNDVVGKDGVELAFEEYLRGKDGKRIVSYNDEGKTTSVDYIEAQHNGDTVSLTLDIDLQQQVEDILARRIEGMVASDGIARGGAAAVVEVGTGDILALASYPDFSLKTYSEDYAELSKNKLSPYLNRAISGTYAPGSTFKPLTAIAALQTGVITPKTTITTRGCYTYYDLRLNCWLYSSTGQTHGTIDVTQALTDSCNYFFYDVGKRTGITTLSRYAEQFGLGQPTGIELSERTGVMTTPDYVNSLKGHKWTDGQTLTAAIGQSYSLFTPLQLANYIATLVDGGTRYPAHLLKSVHGAETPVQTASADLTPLAEIGIDEANLQAVLAGMRRLVTDGSIAPYFKDCIVDAAAKTGTAQTGSSHNNGVFVCFAPYDDPQVAVAIVIEKGGSGGALASTASAVLNACFAPEEAVIRGENSLLP